MGDSLICNPCCASLTATKPPLSADVRRPPDNDSSRSNYRRAPLLRNVRKPPPKTLRNISRRSDISAPLSQYALAEGKESLGSYLAVDPSGGAACVSSSDDPKSEKQQENKRLGDLLHHKTSPDLILHLFRLSDTARQRNGRRNRRQRRRCLQRWWSRLGRRTQSLRTEQPDARQKNNRRIRG